MSEVLIVRFVSKTPVYEVSIRHLINLFDKSIGELNEQEQTELSELLCEFEDVFAKSEFD
jgi:hypothetical protein